MIVDMIVKDVGGYGNQYFVVLDRMPNSSYKYITNTFLQSEDNGVLVALWYERDPHQKAFAGAKFNIDTDRGVVECNGCHWSVSPKCDEKIISVGYATQEELDKCYVFLSGNMRLSEIEQFLLTHAPKTDYYAFEKRNK